MAHDPFYLARQEIQDTVCPANHHPNSCRRLRQQQQLNQQHVLAADK
jgi:hypothetical protein